MTKKRIILVLLVLALIAMPVFAGEWGASLSAGYPSTVLEGFYTFDLPITVDLGLGIDYNYGLPVAFAGQLYGTYGFTLSDLIKLQAGVGVTSRITGGFYIAPSARIGADFNLKVNRGEELPIIPFIRADFGYAIGANKFFWQVQAGAKYTF